MRPLLAFFLIGCGPSISRTTYPDGPSPEPLEDLAAHTVEQTLVAPRVGSVDVLFVLDNSCGMSEERAALQETIGSFFEGLGEAHAHVGAITTDTMERGQLLPVAGGRWIDTALHDPVFAFRDFSALTDIGSADEMGLRTIVAALTNTTRTGFNANFRRNGTPLEVIVLSDEDDAGLGQGNTVAAAVEVLEREGEVGVHAIIGPEGGCQTADPAPRYQQLVEAFGGLSTSICDEPSWPDFLTEVAQRGSRGPFEMYLTEVPDPDTLEVLVVYGEYEYMGLAPDAPPQSCDASLCFDYELDPVRMALVFPTFRPPPGATITVTYERLH